jgi:TonB family protein
MAKKDTTLTAPHGAASSSDNFKAGQPDGNTNKGKTEGKPNAHVKGRNTVGNIPRPAYNVQESGVVVVDIWVDNYGNVVKAVPGGDGTTTLNSSLNTAARNAAMETHFNMSADAPAMQQGTISYYFNLK